MLIHNHCYILKDIILRLRKN